jgi:phosphatidylglycerophosphate synthase
MAKYSYSDVKKSVNRVDSWWSRLVLRHPGSWALYLIANYTNWTPNLLSTLSFIFAILTAFMFFLDSFVVGAILFQFSLLFDFIDGRLARLKKQGSYFGEFLDNFYDQIKAGMLVMALLVSYSIHHADILNIALILNLIIYLFLQEFSVIIWLFAEKNLTNKNEAHLVFESASEKSYIGKFITSVSKKFDKIGLRVLWSNIETNVLIFSIAPLFLGYFSYSLILANIAMVVYMLPMAYVVVKIIKNRDNVSNS